MASTKDNKDIQIKEDGLSSLYTEDDGFSSAGEDMPTNENLTGKTLTFNHADFPWRDVSILHDTQEQYHADISAFTPNKPDITLTDTGSGALVGQAHFRWSLSIKAGVGPSDVSMQWTDMKRGGAFNWRHYSFNWQGKTYVLRRTHSSNHGVEGWRKVMLNNIKIVDKQTGKAVAVYLSVPGIARKRGTLQLEAGLSSELEILCVLGVIGFREKIARSAGGRGGSGAV